jgi:mono/diheme cytochrome c family protein
MTWNISGSHRRHAAEPLIPTLFCLVAALGVLACGGDRGAESAASQAEQVESGAQLAAGPAAPTGPIDAALAESGEEAFRAKGCAGCHTIGGGRLTGPDLQGVTERRPFDWTIAMIMNPDSMIKEDATARQLFAEYMTPMLNVGVTPEEARAIYEFLRRGSEAQP